MSGGFPRVLVANRGEIAIRIINAARDLGIGTVAVFSEADAASPHVDLADEAVAIGPADARRSYLSVDALIDAARRTGCTMLHPGYGFLSEAPELARACQSADIAFVGPSADVIELMGSKQNAKYAARGAGLPLVSGYDGAAQDDARLREEASCIGFPLMIKAVRGGGGRGLRRVSSAPEFAAALARARSEAEKAFGNGDILLEKAIDGARHVEVQVLADAHGNIVHLFDRDCSLQRRHQKVIEEAPSPILDAHQRASLGAQAVVLARSCGYVGAGTVEFIVGADGAPYFIEMNTRLQVEHAVTEAVTGVDLVEWQFRIALGEHLTFKQEDIRLNGHAVEMRLYAEDPDEDFLPQTGTVRRWRPAIQQGARYDCAIAEGMTVGAHYDSMLGKIIAHGTDRKTAIRRLHAVLGNTQLLGVGTNIAFVRHVLTSPIFSEAEHHIGTLETLIARRQAPVGEARLFAAVAGAILHTRTKRPGERPPIAATRHEYVLAHRAQSYRIAVEQRQDEHEVAVGDLAVAISFARMGDDSATLNVDGRRMTVGFALDSVGGIILHLDGRTFDFSPQEVAAAAERGDDDNEISSPMTGLITEILCRPGDVIAPGDALIVVESMKMEHRIHAKRVGRVEHVFVTVGEGVVSGKILISLEIPSLGPMAIGPT